MPVSLLALVALVVTGVAAPWSPPSVQWNASAAGARLPNYGPGEPGGFAIRAIDCLDWAADGRTYCYSDLPLHSNPGCPGSYNSEIGCFSSANGYTNWTFHGIVIHKGQLGSVDSGGVATPTTLATNGKVYLYFSQEGGPPDYKPVTALPNGPRGIGIGRADHPTGPFARLAPAAAAPAWPKNQSWVHGPHPGGIFDDSQVLEYGGQYHLFHSRKLSINTPGCPAPAGGSNPCCVEWRVSSNAEQWVRRGVVLSRRPPCEQQACEPMSARIYGDIIVLVTDGGACGDHDGSLASFTANVSLLGGVAPFAFEPTDPPLLEDFLHFPSTLSVRDWAFRVMPKDGLPRFVGVATGSSGHDRNASFSIFPVGDSPAPMPPHVSSSFTVLGAGSTSWNGIYTSTREGIYQQQGQPSHSLYADGSVWRLAVKGAEMFYVATAHPGTAGPPLIGWVVAQHCNASAGRYAPSCQVGTGPVGGFPPAPHLVATPVDARV